MAAVISGNGLGLFNTSLGQTGIGLGSDARLGAQGADRQYVNVANGNLVLHSQDEQLLFRGMTLGQFRTYNSQGLATQVGSDAWLTGFERRVELLSGTLNAAGSVMRLHTGDGSYQDFTYVAANTYRSTTGDGAHDTLTWTSTSKTWTFVEGSTRREELYADHANATLKGRLTRIRDLKTDGTNPTAWDVLYDGQGRITQIRTKDTTAGGTPDALVFAYDANGRLATLSTRESGQLVGQVAYGYDSVGRLTSVLVDLTPQDGVGDRETWDATTAANNDGYIFRTTYTYADASSLRITQVRQSDGTLVSYGYDAQGRIASVTRGDVNADDSDGIGQTLTFSYDAANRRTDVSDSSGRTWTYVHDAAGQLLEVQSPAIDGQRDVTAYAYDVDGNITQVVTRRGGVVQTRSDFLYDANGNLLWQWDVVDPGQSASATAIQRTWTANNQLSSETRYSGLDPDGVGSVGAPTGGVSTYYVYDAQNRLRFSVDASGAVTESTYATTGAAIGQLESTRRYLGDVFTGTAGLAELTAWATAARRAQSGLATYQYDLRGRLSATREFDTVDATGAGVVTDGTSIVEYIYDAQGLLRQKSVTRHYQGRDVADDIGQELTSYVYDGMGRLLSEVIEERHQLAGETQVIAYRTTAWSYQDSGSTLRTVLEGGLAGDGTNNDVLRNEVRNAAGQLISVTESVVGDSELVRTTAHFYDNSGRLRASEDAGGARTYFFYDAKGALVAQVDATGAVVEYTRDAVGQVVSTTAYASRVPTGGWLVDGEVVIEDLSAIRPNADAQDRIATTSYDALGRKTREVDAEGGITTYTYDGAGRLLQVRSTDAAGTQDTARTTRLFYDAAGREVARLDAEGYLTEQTYDAAGRIASTTAYATATTFALRATGSLDDLRPTASVQDATTRLFHDARGNLVGQLDAEGYFTEYVYDEARNERAVRAYATRPADIDPGVGADFVSLRTAAQGDVARETRRGYDAMGRVLVEQTPDGLFNRFFYDAQGRLVRTIAEAQSSEIRENNQRYDAFGNLIGELGGEGSAQLVEGMSDSDVDAVYAQYGTRHTYDALGRRIESIDAEGNKTWYFYDGVGRLTHTMYGLNTYTEDDYGFTGVPNSRAEVEEIRYDAFGQVRETIAYADTVTIGEPFEREQAASALLALQYTSGTDASRTFRYDRRGLLVEKRDAEGFRATFQYDAFGSLLREEAQRNATQWDATTRTYDRRGLLLSQTEDADGLARLTGAQYDAFGRVIAQTDARGTLTSTTYDRLGRQVTTQRTVSGRNESATFAYDAFGRVVSQIDALGRLTTFEHDDQLHSMTMVTAEGTRVTTSYNGFGQAVEVSNQDGATKIFEFDRDGHLVREGVVDASYSNGGSGESRSFDNYGYASLESETTYEYDRRGLLTEKYDGGETRLYYDERGRLVYQSSAEGSFSYSYDGMGRRASIIDGSDVETVMFYDLEGRLVESVVDPAGIALRTTYTWDAQGRQLTVTEGAGSAQARTTAYVYDGLGRRVSETAAAGSLDLTTTYTYDIDDNLVARTDAEQRTTRYTYDEAGRLLLQVDATGSVVEARYDAAGQKVASRAYANRVLLDGLPAAASDSQLRALLVRDDARDVQQYSVYDADGRQSYSIDGIGAVTAYAYDAAGNVIQTRRHALPIGLDASLRQALADGTLPMDDLVQASDQDRVESFFYDHTNRLRFGIDASGAKREYRYDQGGRLIEERAYVDADYAYLHNDAINGVDAYDVAANAENDSGSDYGYGSVLDDYDRATAYYYDDAGRLRYTVTRAHYEDVDRNDDVYEAPGLSVERIDYDGAGRIKQRYQFGTSPNREWNNQHDWAFEDIYELENALTRENSEVWHEWEELPQRVTTYVYDDAGRTRFVVDPVGAVQENVYDAAGQVVETRQYGALIQLDRWNGDDAAQQIATQLANITDVRVTSQSYDDAGRLLSRTDALQHTESYTYDGAGLVLSHTDKNGATWFYEYDAAGRQVKETSPQVLVASFDAAGNPVAPTLRSVVSVTEYDAFGNVTARIDDATGNPPRITRYEYDSRGNQVRTIFPDAGTSDAYGNITASGFHPTVEVTYDLFGRAVMQKDVLGNYSYKVYNPAGQLAFDIDQEGYVTGYEYNAFGEQSQLRRYAQGVSVAPGLPLDLAGVQSVIVSDDSQDRILVTEYDAAGQKARVVQLRYVREIDWEGNAVGKFCYGPTTLYGYNLYGEVARELQLLSEDYNSEYTPHGQTSTYSVWVATYYWYDNAGRKVAAFQADDYGYTSQEGYLAEWEYDAVGNVRREIQYARQQELSWTWRDWVPGRERLEPPQAGDATTGFDRITSWDYDALGRKIAERSGRGDPALGDALETLTAYDNVGRATSVTVDGDQTRTTYDALGRVTSVRESERKVVVDNANGLLESQGNGLGSANLYRVVSPYSTMAYDAFGNVVQVRRYADGMAAGSSVAVESARDVVHLTRHDWQGRSVWERDAAGTVYTKTYDAADNLLTTQSQLDGNSGRTAVVTHHATYDRLGRQIATSVVRQLNDGGNVEEHTDTVSHVRYNAFGEIIAKDASLVAPVSTEQFAAQYVYDTNGNMIATNAEGGVWKHYGYDQAGRQIAEWHDVRDSQGNVTVVETRMELDAFGNVLRMHLPTNNDVANETTTIERTYDRWGNALEVVDQRGKHTLYQYNEHNQVISETKPEVEVYDADGTSERRSPVTLWEYDHQGRLLATRDANGNWHRNVYDTAGRLEYTEDAGLNRALVAYDALGQKRYAQDAIGYVTWLDYDSAGRVVAQGDFLRNDDAPTRTRYTRERYELNQNGDRLRVTDALGYVSTFDYDSRGLVVRSRTAAGVAMAYEYDLNGNKVRETNALSDSALAQEGQPVYVGGLVDSHYIVAGQAFQYTLPDTAFVVHGGETPTLSVRVLVWDATLGGYRESTDFSFNAQTRLLSGTPSQTGQYVIEVTATSSSGRTAEAKSYVVSLTQGAYDANYASRPRAVSGLSNANLLPGAALSYQIPQGAVVDPNGLPLTWSAYVEVEVTEYDDETKRHTTSRQSQLLGSTPGAHWLAFDAATGTLTGTTSGVQLVDVTFVATNSQGQSVALSMRVDVRNQGGRRTVVDEEGEQVFLDEQTWDYDYFGRLIDHNDLSGADYDYTYDAVTGQQTGQNSKWTEAARRYSTPVSQRWYARDWTQYDLESDLVGLDLPEPELVNDPARQFTYYKSGLLKELREGENVFRYEYDAAGNRTVEEALTHDADGQVLHVITRISYDEQGRMVKVTQRDLTTGRSLLELVYGYDAVGNRRFVSARTAYDPNAAGIDLNGITNPDFEHGTIGWKMGDGWSVTPGGEGSSTLRAQFNMTGESRIVNNERIQVTSGEKVTVAMRVEQGASSAGEAGAAVMIQWYDAAGRALSTSEGNMVNSASGGDVYDSRLTIEVPPGAAFMSVGARAYRSGGGDPLWIDNFSWGVMPANGDMTMWDNSWEMGDGWTQSSNYGGTAQFSFTGESRIVHTDRVPAHPGSTVNARVNVQQGASSAGEAWGAVVVRFYDSGGNLISEAMGNRVDSGSGGAWHQSVVSVVVPSGAVTMSIGGAARRNGGNDPLWLDDFSWNYERDNEYEIDFNLVDPDPSDAYNSNEERKLYWYDYDAENRVTIANGRLQDGQIVLGSADISYALDYDEAGRATRRRFMQGHTQFEETTRYDDRGQRETVFQAREVGSNAPLRVKESYTYDAVGRVVERRDHFEEGSERNGVDVTGWLKHAETFTYDADGRVMRQSIKGRELGWTATAQGDGGGWQSSQLAALTDLSAVDYTAYGYDDAGRLAGYAYHYWKHEDGSGALAGDPKGYTHRYIYQYEAREGYLESRVFGTSSNQNFRASTSYSSYDAWGRRVAVREQTPLSSNLGEMDDRIRYFSYDGEGNILRRREGTLDNGVFTQDATQKLQTQLYAYVGGALVASGKRTGEVDVVGRLTAYQSNDSAGSQRTTVLAGETLRSIAQRVYGNANLWYVLAEANAIIDDSALTAGTTLVVPEVKVTANDSTTFKPFNPAEAIGNTAPSLPYIEPPPKEHCNAVAMVLMVVVAVVVTVFTAGAAAVAMGAAMQGTIMATGAAVLTGGMGFGAVVAGAAFAGGMAGSIASQAVGKAMGVVDDFSLRNAVAGGLTSMASAGIGSLMGGGQTVSQLLDANEYGTVAGMAMANSAAGYAAGRVAGVADTHFSWRAIAASAVTSVVAGKINKSLGTVTDDYISKGVVNDTIGNLVGGVVSLHTRRKFGLDDDINYGAMAADAFGNALGSALVQKMQSSRIKITDHRDADPFSVKAAAEFLEGNYSGEQIDEMWGRGNLFTQQGAIEAATLERMEAEAQRFIAERTEAEMVLTGGPVDPGTYLDRFKKGIGGESAADAKRIIQHNLTEYLDEVRAAAQEKYGKDDAIMTALAQNAALVKIYGAVGMDMPDFQWTYVGAFMAHQVRDEILNVYSTVETGKMTGALLDPVATAWGMPAIEAARDHIINTLVQGQRTVVTDLVSMALTYDEYGAEETSKAMGLLTHAGQAFVLQAQADRLRLAGDIPGAERLGRDAAFKLGVHEQIRLQGMWNDPLLNQMGRVNAVVLENRFLARLGRPLDIYVGANKYTDRASDTLGYMKAGDNLPNMDATQLKTRLQIARDAFDFMYNARQDTTKYNVIQRSFNKFYGGQNLYKLPAIMRPVPTLGL